MREQSPFADLPQGHYAIISADPAWTFLTRSAKGKGRSAERHYRCMTIADIRALPVASLAAKDCMLFFWVTDPHLKIGIDIMEGWGFEYKTVAFTWAKLLKSLGGREADVRLTERAFHFGMGYYTRANPEMCLLGTRGQPKRNLKNVRQLIIAPRREHSRKPDEAYERMRQLAGDGPALDLFTRTSRPGWDSWGDEVGKYDLMEASNG